MLTSNGVLSQAAKRNKELLCSNVLRFLLEFLARFLILSLMYMRNGWADRLELALSLESKIIKTQCMTVLELILTIEKQEQPR